MNSLLNQHKKMEMMTPQQFKKSVSISNNVNYQ